MCYPTALVIHKTWHQTLDPHTYSFNQMFLCNTVGTTNKKIVTNDSSSASGGILLVALACFFLVDLVLMMTPTWTRSAHQHHCCLSWCLSISGSAGLGRSLRRWGLEYTPMAVVILITIPQLHNSFHPMFPTDHCRFVSILRRKVRRRSVYVYGHLSFDVAFSCSTLMCSGVGDLSVWRLECFSSNLVHLYKRYGAKWVTCIRAFDDRDDFSANQVMCNSGFGCAERQILFSDEKYSRQQWGYRTFHCICSFPAA